MFKYLLAMLVVAGLMIGYTAKTSAEDAPKDGKTIFTESKCTMCHSIKALTIETKGKAPDLSLVGDKHNAEFITKFLKKEEKMNDKNHPIAFKGEAKDLETLATWLESLKTEKK